MKILCSTISALGLVLVPCSVSIAADAGGHGNGGGDSAGQNIQGAKEAIKSFAFDSSLKVSLFAAEPLLGNPVAFSPDEKGRWYIAESYRQQKGVEDNRSHKNWLLDDIASRTTEDRLAMMHKHYKDEAAFNKLFTEASERLTRISDTDGDGVADKLDILDDNQRDPLDGTLAGVLVRNGEVWTTSIPHLWHYRDLDAGKPATRESLLSGFGVKFAFRGHDMHGLRFGPDGKLYFSIGDRGINVKTKEGGTVVSPDTGSIMRCNPDGTGFEVFATGVRNPQELVFDQYGNLFTGDNNSDSGDKARFVNLVEGGDCGWRMTFQYFNDRGPWNRELLWDPVEGPKARYLVPPIANIGNGPSGLTYNPGTGLGAKYRDTFFLSDFKGGPAASLVHQIRVEPAGAWFKLKSAEPFVKGVLTTDCEFGPDGNLYVLDWVASWSGVGKGRIYKFTDPSGDTKAQAETAALISEGMSKRDQAALLGLMGHADMRVRMAAQFELASRAAGKDHQSVLEGFAKLAADSKAPQLARLHAIWGTGQVGDAKALEDLTVLLKDGDGEVRAQVAKVLGDGRVAAASSELVALLKDSAPRARFFAALALGKLKVKTAVEPLFEMLAENDDKDPILRHGGVMGLAGCATANELQAKAHHGSVAVRGAAVVALRRLASPAVAVFLNDTNESVVLEAARAINDAPINEAMPALAALSATSSTQNQPILDRVINARYRLGKPEDAAALAAYASKAGASEVARKEALKALGDWGKPSPQDRVMGLWRPLPDRGPEAALAAITPQLGNWLKDTKVQEAAAELVGKLAITAAGQDLADLAENEKASVPARVAALQALEALKDRKLLPKAAKVAMQSKDAKMRTEGLQAFANLDPEGAVTFIQNIINAGSLLEKQGALVALSEIKGQAATKLLGNLLDQMIAGKIAPEIQLDLCEAAKKSKEGSLKKKLGDFNAALAAKGPLEPYMMSLVGGNADRGRKIFREKVEVQCLRCHKCEIGDSQVGPDLTKVGASKTRDYILESIVFPNSKIAQGFGIVSLTLKDGKAVAGRLAAEDANTVKVETTDASGKPMTVDVPVADIKERFNAPSAMPETTRDNLSKAELRDLVEYLSTRK